MTISEQLEQREFGSLAPNATKAAESRGRLKPEEPDSVRTCFQRDVDRIVYSKSFRRLKHKTQVFLQPEGDHYRTRLTHTLEVMRISRTVARALRLNEDLTEAIACGHDLGHTPFGHAGERTLNALMAEKGLRFAHNEQSLRVVDILEKDGEGLNLCAETRDGIVHHTGNTLPFTPEGMIIRTADRIAYINHDIDDACRAGILRDEDIPRDLQQALGDTNSRRINTLVTDMIAYSAENGTVSLSPAVAEQMGRLREFMFERVYRSPIARSEEVKADGILRRLFEYYILHPEELPADFEPQLGLNGIEQTVCDYIAGMTDKYAISRYSELFIPTAWQVRG